MSLPALTEHGLLPLGVHLASLDEVIVAFGSANTRRKQLGDNLRVFVSIVQDVGGFTSLFIDGSFTTDKELPGDIDVVLQTPLMRLKALDSHPRWPELAPEAVKRNFSVHLFVEPAEGGNVLMVKFFQGIKAPELLMRKLAAGTQRGIVKVRL